jgi:hypothetical protein
MPHVGLAWFCVLLADIKLQDKSKYNDAMVDYIISTGQVLQ